MTRLKESWSGKIVFPKCALCGTPIDWSCKVCGEWYCRDCTVYVGSKCLHILRRGMNIDDIVLGVDDE